MTHLCTCTSTLALTLEVNRNRSEKERPCCKICGGSFLIDGIRPSSGGMRRTVGVEVANSTSSELDYKVTKGSHSTKAEARNLNVGKISSQSLKRVGEFSTLDLDKLDEATGKVELPIKKRKHFLQSSSPPPPGVAFRCEELQLTHQKSDQANIDSLKHLLDSNNSSDHCNLATTNSDQQRLGVSETLEVVTGGGFVDERYSDSTKEKLDDSEDYSGLALLSAASCIDNVNEIDGGDKDEVAVAESSASEVSDSSYEVRQKETVDCSESGQLLEEDGSPEFKVESLNPERAVDGTKAVAEGAEDSPERMSNSANVDRLHWDLNTVMDAWDGPQNGSNLVEFTNNSVANDNKVEMGCLEMQREEESTHLNLKTCVPFLLSGETDACSGAGVEENKLEIHFDPKSACTEKVRVTDSHEVSVKPHERAISRQLVDNDASLNSCKSEMFTEGERTAHCFGTPFVQEKNYSGSSAGISEALELTQLAKSHGHLTEGSINKSFCDTADRRKTSKLLSEDSCLGLGFLKFPAVDILDNTSEGAEDTHSLSKCGVLCPPVASTDDSGAIAAGAENQNNNQAADPCMIGSSSPSESEGAMLRDNSGHISSADALQSILHDSCKNNMGREDPATSSGKVGSTFEDFRQSDMSQDNCDQTSGLDAIEIQACYDSPSEDGELRIPVLYSRQQNDLENGEDECVDYDTESRNDEHSDAADFPGSEIVQAASEGSQGVEKTSLLVTEAPEADFGSGSAKSALSRQVEKNDGEKHEDVPTKVPHTGSGTTIVNASTTNMEGNENVTGMEGLSHLGDSPDVIGSSAEVASRASRGKLRSRIEGPLPLDAKDAKDAAFLLRSGSRDLSGHYSRSERDTSPSRFGSRYASGLYIHERGGGDRQWGYGDSRNRYSSKRNGTDDNRQIMQRNVIAESANKLCTIDSPVMRQPASYYSKGMHRHSIRRSSPIETDEYYAVQSRIVPIRGINSNRNRGGSGDYSQRFNGGLREEYRHPITDDADTPADRIPHYLPRRERSFSPLPNRGVHICFPQRKSRSRSRTRSPRAWHPQRGRNLSAGRPQSRSPDFRSQDRIERMRIPQKRTFATDYGENLMSPPRSRFSPDRSCRWDEQRSFPDNHLRQRRSPVRVFRRVQRFDSIGTSGRPESDDYFKPVIPSRRFSLLAGSGRGSKFEDRRRDDRDELIHRPRHSDSGGIMRSFGHNPGDGMEGNSFCNEDGIRGGDRRDFYLGMAGKTRDHTRYRH